MKKLETIFENGGHKWAVIARDPKKSNYIIDTNEYLVSYNGESLLTDPGGMEIFHAVFGAIAEKDNPENISALFSSHQDPDIISSLALWLEFKPELKCHLSWLWAGFIPHFGGDDSTFVAIPDEGHKINLNGLSLDAVPAHYLHSSGNFHLYDPKAKIYFSGDVGAALIPHDKDYLYVENFDEHIQYIKGFHQRWMGSNEAKIEWCERVSKMSIDMLCPQHGAIYTGENVSRFINWFSELPVGVLKRSAA